MSFFGKRILFFSPKFFGYEIEIINSLVKMGAEVDFFDVRPGDTSIDKIHLRLNLPTIHGKINRYYQDISRKFQESYDFVFVIKGEGLNRTSLMSIRKRYRAAKFIYYSYDSMRNSRAITGFFDVFDTCFSFDPEDCRVVNSFSYEPLFYIEKYSQIEHSDYNARKYDFSFVGTIHADRYSVVSRIRSSQVEQMSNFTYFYHPSKPIFEISKLFNRDFYGIHGDEIHFKALTSSQIAKIILDSKSVVDVHHPKQLGLTMRTMEMLGANRKLITTNANVVHHDFFRKENILVIDRNNPVVDLEFFNAPYSYLSDEVYLKYRIDFWLTRILLG
jgi:hypothetical protein